MGKDAGEYHWTNANKFKVQSQGAWTIMVKGNGDHAWGHKSVSVIPPCLHDELDAQF